MKQLLFLSLLLCSFASFGQRVVLRMSPAADTLEPSSGPNYKHYVHSFMSFGTSPLSGDVGGKTKPGLDHFSFGYRTKLRLAEHFAIGYDLAYSSESFNLKQELTKTSPDNGIYDSQRLIFHSIRGGLYMRFNAGRRGNSLGKYLDLGGFGEWVFGHTQFTKFKLSDNSVVRVRRSKLEYYQPFNYGLSARLGFNQFILFGNYRMSDIFFKPYGFVEMPRLMVGLQFVLG